MEKMIVVITDTDTEMSVTRFFFKVGSGILRAAGGGSISLVDPGCVQSVQLRD